MASIGLTTAFRLARRDLRGGLAGFRIFLLSLGLGVAAIAAVGSLTASIVDGLRDNGRLILGADIDLRLIHRSANETERAWLERNAVAVSETLEMRTIARVPDGDERTLVELKAVDRRYPLYGEVVLKGGGTLDKALAPDDGRHGAVIEPTLAERFRLEPGDELKIGDVVFEVRALIEREPDRGTGGGVTLGPRVMISDKAMAETGLVQVGSLIYWHYKLKLPPGAAVEPFVERMTQALPDAGWRVRDRERGAPGVESFLERLRVFLTLVGLTALLVGGVGVGNAVKAHLDAKRTSIAVLKCVGATGGDITRVFLIEILVLAAVGILAGLVVGAATPFLAQGLLAAVLPAAPSAGLFAGPLALAALFGLLVTLAFALWPLGVARRTRAAGLFRAIVAEHGERPPGAFIIGTALALLGLSGVALLSSDRPLFALYFVLGAAGCFAVLRLAAAAIARAAAQVEGPRRSAVRMALANLHRPGAPTASVMVSLGLGVTLLAAVAQIEGNVKNQIDRRVSEDAPAFFFVDIQPHQLEPFIELARGTEGVSEVRSVPALRGRITALNGKRADELAVDPDEAWVLRGDRGITYASEPPANSPVVAGRWWPADYDGPPLVSFEDEAAAGLGVGIGDTLTVNVLGREITATIASLRRIEWSTFGINYLLIFDPATLKGAPHTHIATAQATPEAETPLYRAVTDAFPNVSGIRVRDAIQLVEDVLSQVSTAVRSAAAVTLAAGLLVLGGAIAAGHRRRVHEAVVLKVIGATRPQILRINAVEFLVLGAVTAVVAAFAGTGAAWFVVEEVMSGDLAVLPVRLAVVVVGAVGLTAALGLLGAWRALGRRPAAELRVE